MEDTGFYSGRTKEIADYSGILIQHFTKRVLTNLYFVI